jgi:hypothetical protein
MGGELRTGFRALCFAALLFLAACSSGLSDEQIIQDLSAHQKKLGQAQAVARITRGDGWADGQEVRAYVATACPMQRSQSPSCTDKYYSLSYQRHDDGSWSLLSIEPGAGQ